MLRFCNPKPGDIMDLISERFVSGVCLTPEPSHVSELQDDPGHYCPTDAGSEDDMDHFQPLQHGQAHDEPDGPHRLGAV